MYEAYSDADRRRAPLTTLELPGDVFDWYASLLVHRDRAYYQVLPSGFSHDLDLPAAFAYGARFYLLPAVEGTHLAHATVVVSYHADPGVLPANYVTQRRSGLQPIFVSRIGVPDPAARRQRADARARRRPGADAPQCALAP